MLRGRRAGEEAERAAVDERVREVPALLGEARDDVVALVQQHGEPRQRADRRDERVGAAASPSRVRRALRPRRGVHVVPLPELEHAEAPEPVPVVGAALGVLARSRFSSARRKRPRSAPPSSRSSASGRSSSRNQRSSGTPKPALPRPAISGGRSAANACLSAALPRGELGRQREPELDHAVVEERRAQLERDGHRGEVGLRQQVARAGTTRCRRAAGRRASRQVGARRVRERLVRPEPAPQLERERPRRGCA